MTKNAPPERKLQPYYGDTEFGQYDYNLGRQGYQGLNNGVDKVNTINQDTQSDINSRLGNIYNRQKQDFGIDYNNQMAKQLASQYGRMGTLNSTSGLYANDQANRTAQRALQNINYNQAEGYENAVDRELQRRYNALNEYQKMYGLGQTTSQQDYKTGITNQDIAYQNDYNNWSTDQANKASAIQTAMQVASIVATLYRGGLIGEDGLSSDTLSNGDMSGVTNAMGGFA